MHLHRGSHSLRAFFFYCGGISQDEETTLFSTPSKIERAVRKYNWSGTSRSFQEFYDG
jgi:hypothetical protein